MGSSWRQGRIPWFERGLESRYGHGMVAPRVA